MQAHNLGSYQRRGWQPWRLFGNLGGGTPDGGGNLGSVAEAYEGTRWLELLRGTQYEWQYQWKKGYGVGGGLWCAPWKRQALRMVEEWTGWL